MSLTPQVIWTAIAALSAFVVIGLIAAGVRGRSRALEQPAEEVTAFDIRPLTAAERERSRADWWRVEARFVERPATAVVEAEKLLSEIMTARGYPVGDFDRHAVHLSVKHPAVVEHYRAGHAVLEAHNRGAASTEDLRQAMLHYRALFDELAGGRVARADVPSRIRNEQEIERLRPV